MKIGYIGLGKMGKNMVLRFLEKGIEVVAWNRSAEPRQEVKEKGAIITDSVEELVTKLETPRIIWLMLPSGEPTDEILNKITPLLSKDDLVIDGANAFYKDTLKRGQKLNLLGIHYMDIGVSGGPDGARNGACLMVGGNEIDYQKVLPLIEVAAAPKAYGYFGKLGSGHFSKMVHNGIEYGMMEAIAEGLSVLKNSNFELNLVKVLDVYNNKSVIESRLIGWVQKALTEDNDLVNTSSEIGDLGEGKWTIDTAKELGVPVPIIEKSYEVRLESREGVQNPKNIFRNKVVSAMRGQFGHHDIKLKQ